MRSYQHLYLHVPFCAGKCAYCAFYSEPYSTRNERLYFVDHLISHIQKNEAQLQNLKTIFIGGGTPTLLEPVHLERLMKAIDQHTAFADPTNYEFSVENNPEGVTGEKLHILSENRVNRISIGIQSFSKKWRNVMGRIGNLDKLDYLVDEALKYGLENINFDFIYGIPNQPPEAWQADMKEAANYPIQHLSAYSLTIEEGTALADIKMVVDDEAAVELQNWTVDFLRENAGLHRYEVSNYSKPGKRCQHNHSIWMGDSYLGLGPSASSFDGRVRWQEPSSLHPWILGEKPEIDEIPVEARAREIFTIGLRTLDGWDIPFFSEQTGFTLSELYPAGEIDQLLNEGMLAIVDGRIKPTAQGLLFADHIGTTLI